MMTYQDAAAETVRRLDDARRSGQPVHEHKIIETMITTFVAAERLKLLDEQEALRRRVAIYEGTLNTIVQQSTVSRAKIVQRAKNAVQKAARLLLR